MSKPTERILRLRQHALEQKDKSFWLPLQLDLLAERAWVNSSQEPWSVIRHAHETAAIFLGLEPAMDDLELIVGKYDLSPLTPLEEKELSFIKDGSQKARPLIQGMKAHMAIDFDKLLRLGVAGITQQIKGYQQKLDLAKPENLAKDAFYRSCLITLDALVIFAHRYSEKAFALSGTETNQGRQQELIEIARILKRVPEFPPQSFYEALQAVHFVTFSLGAGTRTALFQYGRPDRYLLPFYRRDIAQGLITREKALELIDCLGLLQTEYVPVGLAVGWMVGGRDASGNDICNDLTRLFLESIEHVHLAYPGVGLCWTSETPSDIMDLASSLLSQGFSHPALFNDDVITAGLSQVGLPPAEACLYQNSTCVEITPIATSNVYVASPYINLVQILHDVIGLPSLNGITESTPVPKSDPVPNELPENFTDLIAAYRKRLGNAVREAVIDQNTQQATRYLNGGQPLLSCFVNDCLARGMDIDQGGARYNWIEPSFVGLANLVDSLETIRSTVFVEHQMTLNELVAILRDDFKGNESFRLMVLNRIPKYGNDNDLTDSLAGQVAGWIREEVKQYRSYLGGEIISGFFTWIMHEQLGRKTSASADGRRAGFPLSAGSGASQGSEKCGPTAAVLSSTKWDHAPHLGGIAVNFKFNKPRDDEVFSQRLLDVVTTYLNRGGFEVQVNVVDRGTLESARQNPEQYRDLVVRIGGYSDYFTRLSSEMQDELILRSDHTL